MKTKKSRVVLSSVSVLLVLSLLAGMTMAWFTDTEKVNANFTAGVLDVSVKPGETDEEDLTFENLRPMLYDNFYKELEPNGNEKWDNDVTQDNTTGLEDEDYAPVPAYFKPVVIKNEGTLPAKVKLSLEAGDGCEAGEPILTEDNITIKQDPEKMQDCANRLAPVLKVFVYKLVGETWTKVEDVNLNTAYDEAKANPDKVTSDNTAKETNNTYMTAMLPAQGTATYVIAGYLPETVNNAYQGQHFHGKLVLNAYQMDDTGAGKPDEGGSSSTDPEDPDRFEDNVTIEWHEETAEGDLVKSQNETVKSDTTIAAVDYPAPDGYVYSPEAAEQKTDVVVDEKTGEATPGKVIFTVVPEEAKAIEYVLYYINTVDDQLLTQTETVSLEYPGEYTIVAPNAPASRTRATEKDRISAPIPAGYVFDPDTQAYDVAVNAEGTATPTRITFAVKPESTEPTDPDPEEHPEAYQVRVDFRNQETGVLLDQSYSKTYSGLTKGVHNFTPVGEAQNDTEVLHYVTAPEGYEYDPAGQSAKFVTIPAAKGPEVIEFTVKEVGGEEPEPEEKEVVIQWWCVDPSHEYNYNPDNPAAHKNDHEAGSANYTVTLKEGETKTISTADVGQPGGRYYIDPDPQSVSVTLKDGVLLDTETQEPITDVRFTVRVKRDADYLLGGDGSSLHPFMVSDEYELDRIENHMSSHFRLVKDIDLGAYTWTPMGISSGNADIPFRGTLEGQGHAINNLRVSLPGGGVTGYAGGGVFAYNKGSIKDLNIHNANVTIGAVAGTLAGQNAGTIENCHVDGTVTTTGYADVNMEGGTAPTHRGSFTGGLVGVNGGTIKRCSAEVEIKNTYTWNNVGNGGSGCIGGLVGLNYHGTVEESWAEAALNKQYYQTGTINGNLWFVGGLVGHNDNGSVVRNCWANAAPVCGHGYIGGLIGYNRRSTVESSYGCVGGWAIGSGMANTAGDCIGGVNGGNISHAYYAYDKQSGYGTRVDSLTDGQHLAGFDTSVWTFVEGSYPNLVFNPR